MIFFYIFNFLYRIGIQKETLGEIMKKNLIIIVGLLLYSCLVYCIENNTKNDYVTKRTNYGQLINIQSNNNPYLDNSKPSKYYNQATPNRYPAQQNELSDESIYYHWDLGLGM